MKGMGHGSSTKNDNMSIANANDRKNVSNYTKSLFQGHI